MNTHDGTDNLGPSGIAMVAVSVLVMVGLAITTDLRFLPRIGIAVLSGLVVAGIVHAVVTAKSPA